MALGFTNTSGTGFNYLNTGSGSADRQVTKPTDAANPSLLVALYSTSDGNLGGTDNAVITNITGETIDDSVQNSTLISSQLLHYQFSGAPPSTFDFNSSLAPSVRANPVALIFTGYDTTTPIRNFAHNSGTGTTVTYPDITSATNGDKLFRYVWVDNADFTITISTPTSHTVVVEDENDGSFRNVFGLYFKDISSTGAPGTATSTLGQSRSWVAFTFAVAVAGAGSSVLLTNLERNTRGEFRGEY